MAPGSTYQEDINGPGTGTGPGNYSRLLVTGAGNQFIASGATLNANLTNITGAVAYTPYVPKLGDTFRIITADGGIVGNFAAFAQPAGLAMNTRMAVFYDYLGSNSIDLRVVPTSYATSLANTGINANARSVGGALDQLLAAAQAGTSTTAQNDLAFLVSGLTLAQLPGAMTALAGEVHADLAAAAPQADQWLQGSVARQLESGGTIDSTGAPVPGQAFWLDASAGHGHWNTGDEATGFAADRAQVALGIELLADQPNRIGVGFSHSLTDVSTAGASGSVEANTGFLYGQATLGAAVLDGMLAAGGTRWESVRGDPLAPNAPALRTSEHGTDTLASAGLRFPIPVGGLVLQPYARTIYQRSSRGEFDEGAAVDALTGPSYAAHGLRTLAGVSAGSANGATFAAPYTYRVNLGIGHDNGDLVHPAVAATLSGVGYTINAPDVGRNFAQLSVSGTARIGRHSYVYLALSDEARSGKSEEEDVTLGVRANF
jgi:outer membrane autotransporter protein